jgi:hypothetical protein
MLFAHVEPIALGGHVDIHEVGEDAPITEIRD